MFCGLNGPARTDCRQELKGTSFFSVLFCIQSMFVVYLFIFFLFDGQLRIANFFFGDITIVQLYGAGRADEKLKKNKLNSVPVTKSNLYKLRRKKKLTFVFKYLATRATFDGFEFFFSDDIVICVCLCAVRILVDPA